SLEDDLMRIFGSESMNNILEKLGLKDGESIDHSWINKALERAQQKVEARNFDVRKTLLKFDNVLNDQRKVIFSQRNNIIGSKNAFEYSDGFLNEILTKLKELKKLNLSKDKNSEYSIQIKSILGKSFQDNQINSILGLNDEDFEKEIKNKFFKKRSLREQKLDKEGALELEKRILLQLIDQNWKSHIQYLEQLRGVIGLRSYGNRDPLVEYKKEAFSLFENLLFKLKSDLITVLLNLEVIEKKEDAQKVNNDQNSLKKKIGRNEPCPCNSGKKYKHCHGSV
ncbi:MAG: SEC-C domain-containing protein, partial [Pelagibacterales bacterium]|nr:SEC-C domain-containing protein [Pelagibacterales bacterium]